jgi:transcriptional antiterminator
MTKKSLSIKSARQEIIVKYLLSQSAYKTPKEIEKAIGINHKEITRSISDIRQCDSYITKSIYKPFRVRLFCTKKNNELWRFALFGRIYRDKKQEATIKVCGR